MVCFCVCIADGLIVRYDLSGRSGFIKGISCLTQASYNVFRARNRSALVYASNQRTARFLRKRKKSRAPKQPGLFLSILSIPFPPMSESAALTDDLKADRRHSACAV